MDIGIVGERPGVTLHVQNVRRASEWYRDILGLTLGPTDGTYYAELLTKDTFLFHLIYAKDAVPLQQPVIQLQSCDITRTHQELADGGIEVTPISWNTDNAGFHCIDGEGNAIGIIQFFSHRVVELGPLNLAGLYMDINSTQEEILARIQEVERQIPQESTSRIIIVHDSVHTQRVIFIGYVCHSNEEYPAAPTTMRIPAQFYGLKWHYGSSAQTQQTFEALVGSLVEQGYTPGEQRLEFHKRPYLANPTEANLYVAVTQKI